MTVNRKTRSDDKPEIPFSALLESEDWISMGITAGLTRREAQVLHCALDDERDAVIATRLTIAESTVRTHKSRAMRQLGVRSLMRAVCVLLLQRERKPEL